MKWLLAPLVEIDSINQRLDTIEDLTSHPVLLEDFRSNLGRLPDLERMMNRLFTYSLR